MRSTYELAKEVIELEEEHEKLGLSQAEMAFYHAVNRPEHYKTSIQMTNLFSLQKIN